LIRPQETDGSRILQSHTVIWGQGVPVPPTFQCDQAFFDDIINHRFTPGDTYNTCHQRFSLLAFLPKTHAGIHEEINGDEILPRGYGTVKTVGDIGKHRTKGPLPTMRSATRMLRLYTRDVKVLKSFFTPWSSLVIEETELNHSN
jgi:hypothetical protein